MQSKQAQTNESEETDLNNQIIEQGQQKKQNTSIFSHTEEILKRFTDQYERTKQKQITLSEGLQKFDEKRQLHESNMKKQRQDALAKKYQIKYGENQESAMEKSHIDENQGIYRLNKYIITEIFRFLAPNLFFTLVYYSRVSKRFLYLIKDDDLLKDIAIQILGSQFVELNLKNQISFQKANIDITNNGFSYWRLILEYSMKQYCNCSNSIRQYKSQNCPLQFSNNSTVNQIQVSLRFMLEILNLVMLNQSKQFLLYKQLSELIINDQDAKGVYSLLCLAQCESELLKYDAADILVTLIGLEPKFREKISKLVNIFQVLKKMNVDQQLLVKLIFNNEMQILMSQTSLSLYLWRESFMYGQLIYNSFINQSSWQQFSLVKNVLQRNKSSFYEAGSQKSLHYDLNDSERDLLKVIDSIASKQESFGIYYDNDKELLVNFTVKYQLKSSGEFTARGLTSLETKIEINGQLKLNQKEALQKQYEYLDGVSYFGEGVIKCYIEQILNYDEKFNSYLTFAINQAQFGQFVQNTILGGIDQYKQQYLYILL